MEREIGWEVGVRKWREEMEWESWECNWGEKCREKLEREKYGEIVDWESGINENMKRESRMIKWCKKVERKSKLKIEKRNHNWKKKESTTKSYVRKKSKKVEKVK